MTCGRPPSTSSTTLHRAQPWQWL